jgi:hypothetical protein
MEPMDLGSANVVERNVSALARSADAGHFAIDLAAGQQMVGSIKAMREELQVVLTGMADVKRRAHLGDLPEAQHIANRNVEVATGDAQSAEAVLRLFDRSLEQAEYAVQQGMRNYAEVEEQARRGVAPE